jgi:fucose 4-O-acetylase-like acetyltransferase
LNAAPGTIAEPRRSHLPSPPGQFGGHCVPIIARQRDLALDALKGLAIIGVMFAHWGSNKRYSAGTLNWIGMVQQCFGWCVLAFFFSAGVLTRIKHPDSTELLHSCIKRARRLLVPCLAFSIAYKLCFIALKSYANVGDPTPFPKVNVLEWCEFILLPIGPQFYFLPYLFVISSLSLLAVNMAKDMAILSWMILIGCVVFYALRPAPLSTYGSSWTLIPCYTLSFWLGLKIQEEWRQNQLWWSAVVLIIFVASLVRGTMSYAQVMLPVVGYGILREFPLNKALTFLGRKSGLIYVWHAPLLFPACGILASKIVPTEAAQVGVTLALTVAVSIVLGQMVNRCKYLSIFHI